MTTRFAPTARSRLVARTEPIDDPGDLLDHLGPGGFAWLDGDTGFVTRGVAARVPSRPRRAAALGTRSITTP